MQWDPDLKQDLNTAINANIGDHAYKVVAALLLSWEDKVKDLPEVKDEISKLHYTFEEAYRFVVMFWPID